MRQEDEALAGRRRRGRGKIGLEQLARLMDDDGLRDDVADPLAAFAEDRHRDQHPDPGEDQRALDRAETGCGDEDMSPGGRPPFPSSGYGRRSDARRDCAHCPRSRGEHRCACRRSARSRGARSPRSRARAPGRREAPRWPGNSAPAPSRIRRSRRTIASARPKVITISISCAARRAPSPAISKWSGTPSGGMISALPPLTAAARTPPRRHWSRALHRFSPARPARPK